MTFERSVSPRILHRDRCLSANGHSVELPFHRLFWVLSVPISRSSLQLLVTVTQSLKNALIVSVSLSMWHSNLLKKGFLCDSWCANSRENISNMWRCTQKITPTDRMASKIGVFKYSLVVAQPNMFKLYWRGKVIFWINCNELWCVVMSFMKMKDWGICVVIGIFRLDYYVRVKVCFI